jgi:hypothetical protein
MFHYIFNYIFRNASNPVSLFFSAIRKINRLFGMLIKKKLKIIRYLSATVLKIANFTNCTKYKTLIFSGFERFSNLRFFHRLFSSPITRSIWKSREGFVAKASRDFTFRRKPRCPQFAHSSKTVYMPISTLCIFSRFVVNSNVEFYRPITLVIASAARADDSSKTCP